MIKFLLEIFDRRFIAKLSTVKRGPDAWKKLSRRQAMAWEAGARAGIYHAINRDFPS